MSNLDSPFLRLPSEIRLMIYGHLLLPSTSASLPSTAKSVHADYHDYEHQLTLSRSVLSTAPTLQIRTLDPTVSVRPGSPRLRTTYAIRHDRFRARIMHTTYTLLSNPGLHPSILGVSRQTYAEAADLLYSSYVFAFDTHVEAIVPFLSDLTPFSRARVRKVALTKRALPYCKEFDRLEWAAACRCLASLALKSLELGVVAGKPSFLGWDDPAIPSLEVSYFAGLDGRNGGGGGWGNEVVDMEWARQLMVVRGLRECRVRAIVEHCPPPVSDMMAFWVALSKSVEGAFGEWVRGVMCEVV